MAAATISLIVLGHRRMRRRHFQRSLSSALARSPRARRRLFTDKAAWNALTASAELRPLNTFLPRRPGGLTDWINDQPIPATCAPAT